MNSFSFALVGRFAPRAFRDPVLDFSAAVGRIRRTLYYVSEIQEDSLASQEAGEEGEGGERADSSNDLHMERGEICVHGVGNPPCSREELGCPFLKCCASHTRYNGWRGTRASTASALYDCSPEAISTWEANGLGSAFYSRANTRLGSRARLQNRLPTVRVSS